MLDQIPTANNGRLHARCNRTLLTAKSAPAEMETSRSSHMTKTQRFMLYCRVEPFLFVFVYKRITGEVSKVEYGFPPFILLNTMIEDFSASPVSISPLCCLQMQTRQKIGKDFTSPTIKKSYTCCPNALYMPPDFSIFHPRLGKKGKIKTNT